MYRLSIWSAASAALVFSGVSRAESFDYIIAGGGTCGLLLANRLSKDPSIRVAVIDPGADQRENPQVTDPARWTELSTTPVNWGYSSVPQPDADGRVLAYQAGKGIGGTSLVNGMTYIRGDKAQFDAWEDIGNTGWNWETMFEYYKKVEKFFTPEPWQVEVGASFEPENHGRHGDLHVGFTPILQKGSFYGDARQSWASLGQSLNKDVNSGVTEGFDVWPQTLDPLQNKRWDAATAFYWPVQDRKNLKLINGTVSKIVWSHGCNLNEAVASGVEYVNADNEKETLVAKKEVILSAGALRTPLILELSGIGNPQILEEMGIDTVVDSPSVGENMIDQPNLSLIYSSGSETPNGTAPYATFVNAKDLFGDEVDDVAASTKASLSQWAKQLADASNGGLNATAIERLFQIQHDLIFKTGVTLGETLSSSFQTYLVSAYWALLPFSRGSVHLSSVTAINKPAIDPKFLAVDFDLKTQVAIGRLTAKFWATAPVKDVVGGQLVPNTTVLPPKASDEQWASFTTGSLTSNAHSIGTAAMMARELGGVVDPSLKVYGTKNVRVVDASVLPMQFSGHLTATLYAVAERAAEMMIKESK